MAIWVLQDGRRQDLFADKARGAVLDIPAGAGLESAHLQDLGFKTVLGDLFPDRSRQPNLAWVHADAMQPFPFSAGVFDYVLSREGIEHFEHQAHLINECARVLKSGGCLVVTTPNIINLRARISYLLTGQRTLRRGLVNEVQTLRRNDDHGRPYHGHVFLIDYFRLRYLLRLAGFDKIQVYTDYYSPTSVAFAWLVPFLYIASKLSLGMGGRKFRKRKYPVAADSVGAEILSHVLSKALLFGKRMIVVAEKTQ